MCSFGLSSVICKVFVAEFEHVVFCWKRYCTKTTVVLILKYLAHQTNTCSKSAVETLKANSRDCAFLFTTCSMSNMQYFPFNKVVGLQYCEYTKKRLQHWWFMQNLRKFLRAPLLKNICELCFSN